LRGLGRVAATVVVGMENEADLALTVLGARPVQVAFADELTGRPQLGGEAEGVALGDDRGRAHLDGQRLADLGRGARVPVEVAGDIGTRLDREQRLEVGRRERAQAQTLGEQRVVRLHGTQVSASGVTCSSWVAERAPCSARKTTAPAISRGSASAAL